MDRIYKHRGAVRRMVPHLKATAVAVTLLGVCGLGTADIAYGQVGVESAIVNSGAATPAKPLKMSGSGPIQVTIGSPATAEASRDTSIKGPNCVGAMRAHSEVTVPVGKSTMVQLPEPVRNRTVGNPNVVQAMLVSPQTLYLLGQEVGTTNMIVQGRSGSCSVIDVAVGADPGGLLATLHELVPDAKNVRVSAAADSLVLGGSVSDSVQAQKVVDIANAFVTRQTPSPSQHDQGGSQGASSATQGAPTAPGAPLRSPRIINMMAVEAPQQVMLEVKVAEVSKTLIDQMGSAFNLNGAFGSWSFGAIANFLSSSQDLVSFSKANHLPLKFALDAQRGDGLVKVLAEPSLMAISGQEASFLAGGKVFIPVPQSTNGISSTIVLQEETFGVGLRFTPTVMENGRINLKVAPEVSELSPTGVAVSAANTNGTTILPLITTRRASTTLQVRDGQSFAIGGLIKSNITGSLKALPGIGELPVIGSLARSTSFQQDQTELLFVVTPRLVKPLPAQYPLPTDSFGPVNRGELYLNGNMEGHPVKPAAAPAAAATPTAAPASAAGAPTPAVAPSSDATPPAEPTTPAAPAQSTPSAVSAAPELNTWHFVATGDAPLRD